MEPEEPTQSLCTAQGDELLIRKLVQRFHAITDSDLLAAGIRACHPPFPIAPSEAEQWMHCMTHALEGMGPDKSLAD